MKATALLVPFLSLVFATAASANLLSNADFDDGLSGWNDTQAASWSDEDSDRDGSSGSARLEVSDVGSERIWTCVPIDDPGQDYQLGVDILLDVPSNVTGRAGIVVRFRGEADCGGADLTAFPANTFLTFAPDWQTQSATFAVPASAVSARVELVVTKTGGSGQAVTAWLDDALFQSLGSLPVPSCGDPLAPFGTVTAADALSVLRSALEIVACQPCVCDVDDSGATTSSDALVVLRAAVGLSAGLDCDFC